MRILSIAVFLAVILASCSRNEVNPNSTPANNNAANTASSANSGNATAKSYPQETIDAFLKSCQGAGSEPSFCACVLDKVQAQYTFEEFAKIESQIQEGEPSREFIQFSEKARAECQK